MGGEIKYYRRFHGYDYSRGASLFITMATDPRRSVFGRVVNAKVERSLLGEKVFESLEAIPAFNPGLKLFEHELMPDHLHCNLYLPPITPGGAGESGQGGAGESGQGGAGESGQGGAGESGRGADDLARLSTFDPRSDFFRRSKSQNHREIGQSARIAFRNCV